MKKILVIEDDDKISLALSVRLRASGYQVSQAFDALQGMSMAVKGTPDLILLDISMPAGDGFQLAERFQHNPNTAGVPVIFMTASKKTGLRRKALDLGARGFFEKPFAAEDVIEAIDDVLSHPETTKTFKTNFIEL